MFQWNVTGHLHITLKERWRGRDLRSPDASQGTHDQGLMDLQLSCGELEDLLFFPSPYHAFAYPAYSFFRGFPSLDVLFFQEGGSLLEIQVFNGQTIID